jgi:hypothetical protein
LNQGANVLRGGSGSGGCGRLGSIRGCRFAAADGNIHHLPFDRTTLAIRDAPETWTHDGFARSGRDFIHIYQTKKRAILIRLLSKAGTVLDNPLLKRIHKNLAIIEDQWIGKFPSTELRKSTRQKTRELPLTPDVVNELRDAIARARELLNLGRRSKPNQVADAIHQAIDEIRSRKRVSAQEKKQLGIDLGALWGDALCTARKWEWCCVSQSSKQQVYAVCSPNRSHAIDPIRIVHSILQSRRVANNSLLLFNLILSGRLPESPAGYCWLS